MERLILSATAGQSTWGYLASNTSTSLRPFYSRFYCTRRVRPISTRKRSQARKNDERSKMVHRNTLVLGLLVASACSATVANAARLQKTKLKNAREDYPPTQDNIDMDVDIDDEEPLQLLTNEPRQFGRRSLIHETAAGAPTAAPTEWQLSEDWWTDTNPPPPPSTSSNNQDVASEYRTPPAGAGGAIGGCQTCLQQYPNFHLQTAHLCPATCYQYAPGTTGGGGNQRPAPNAASNGNVGAAANDADSYRITGDNINCFTCRQTYSSPNVWCPERCFPAYPSSTGGQQAPPLPAALQELPTEPKTKTTGTRKSKTKASPQNTPAYEDSWSGQTAGSGAYGGSYGGSYGGTYGGTSGSYGGTYGGTGGSYGGSYGSNSGGAGAGAGTGDFRDSAALNGCWDCIKVYPDKTMEMCPGYCYEAARYAPGPAPAPYPSHVGYYPSSSYGGYNAQQPYPSHYYQPYPDYKPPTYVCDTCFSNCPSGCGGGYLTPLAPSPWHGGIHPSKPTWNWGTPSPTQSAVPSSMPSPSPTGVPSPSPSDAPSAWPSSTPSCAPSSYPSSAPSRYPSAHPSSTPSRFPSSAPSRYPSTSPSSLPSRHPSRSPSSSPSWMPTDGPTAAPTISHQPSTSSSPSNQPSISNMPTTGRSVRSDKYRNGGSDTSTTGTTIATGKTGKSDSAETSSTTGRSKDEVGNDTSTTGTTDTSGTSDSALTSSTTGSKTKTKSNEGGRRRRRLAGGSDEKKKDKITEEKTPKTNGELESHAEEKTTQTVEKKSKRPDDPEYHAGKEHRVACPTCYNSWSYDTYYNMWYNAYYQEWYSEYYNQYYGSIDQYYQDPWGYDSGGWGKGDSSSSSKKSKKGKKKSKSSSSGMGKGGSTHPTGSSKSTGSSGSGSGSRSSSGDGPPPRPEIRCNEDYYPTPKHHHDSGNRASNRGSNADALNQGRQPSSSVKKVPAIAGGVAGFVVLVVALAFFFVARGRRKDERDSRRSSSRHSSSTKGRKQGRTDRDRRRRDKRGSSHRSDRSDDTDQTEVSAEDVAGALPSYLSGVRVGPGGNGNDVELARARGIGVSEKQVSWRDGKRSQQQQQQYQQRQEGAWPSLFNDLTFDSLNSWIAPRSNGGA